VRILECTDSRQEVPFIPLYDIHRESQFCDVAAFHRTIQEIKKRKAWTFIGGDLVDVDIKGSVRNAKDSTMSLSATVATLAEELEPIKDRLLGGIDGNHEHAAIRDADLSLVELLCDRLGIPYCGDQAVIRMHIAPGKNGPGRMGRSATIYAIHGSGGGSTEGATLNAVAKLTKMFNGADVYLCGHTHAPVADWVPVIELVQARGEVRLMQRPVWLVNAGSFQQWTAPIPLTEREKGNGWHQRSADGFAVRTARGARPIGMPVIMFGYGHEQLEINVPIRQV
jgi:hypothetical protein